MQIVTKFKRMGRELIKVYEYSLDGRYRQEYLSMAEYKIKHYKNTQYPCFNKRVDNIKYDVRENTIAFCGERVYRDDVRYYLKIINSKLCNLKKKKTVEVVNIEGKVVAEYYNKCILVELMPHLNKNTVYRQLETKRKARYFKNGDVSFRYKI